MDRDLYILLIYKELKGEISEEESHTLTEWLDADPEHLEIERNIRLDWQLSGNYEPNIKLDLEEEFSFLQSRIEADEQSVPKEEAKVVGIDNKKKSGNTGKWLALAASIALFIAAGFWVFNNSMPKENWEYMATAENETKSVVLPDGTEVILNENSRLDYPDKFLGDSRQIELKGEAFFDVVRNVSQPFKIISPTMETTVLGTSFNLEDYPEKDEALLSVFTGKVKFGRKENPEGALILEEGENAFFVKSKDELFKMGKSHINANAWYTQVLTFKNRPLPEVIDDLAHHFDVTIGLHESLVNCRFNSVYKNPDLERILVNLSSIYKAEWKKTNEGRYTIGEGSCN